MEIQIATLCDSAADYGGKLSMLGAFDTIGGPEFPVVHNQCALAMRVSFDKAEEGEQKLSIRFMDSEGNPLSDPVEPVIPVRMPDDIDFMTRNLVLNMQRLKFDRPGVFTFEISGGGQLLAKVPLRVLQVQMPQGAPPADGPEEPAT